MEVEAGSGADVKDASASIRFIKALKLSVSGGDTVSAAKPKGIAKFELSFASGYRSLLCGREQQIHWARPVGEKL